MNNSKRSWRCHVSLQIVFDEVGLPLGHPETVEFGSTICKPDEVEDRVRRAQWALLNPSALPESFLRNRPTGVTELHFTKNYISVQIEGPDVTDLSLVDLPGIVASLGFLDAFPLTNSS